MLKTKQYLHHRATDALCCLGEELSVPWLCVGYLDQDLQAMNAGIKGKFAYINSDNFFKFHNFDFKFVLQLVAELKPLLGLKTYNSNLFYATMKEWGLIR